jgi:hypothetical protein
MSGRNITIRNGNLNTPYINNTSTTSIFYNLYNNNLYLTYSTVSGLTSSSLIYYSIISSNLLSNYINLYSYSNNSLSGLINTLKYNAQNIFFSGDNTY